ncbi:hypothetical protein BG000_001431 [Podila horticola]|nr:hypothetical protein BG000_001431 [Podila horticola]
MDSKGWTILLDVYLAFIVAYVKRLIHDKISATNNQLVPKYGTEVLKDDHSRSDSNIWNRTNLYLADHSNTSMPVFIQTPAGKTITLQVDLSEIKQNLNSMYQKKDYPLHRFVINTIERRPIDRTVVA